MVKVVRKNLASDNPKEEQSQAVMKMRDVSIEEEAAALAIQHGFLYIDLHVFPMDTEDVLTIPEAEAKKNNIALFNKKNTLVRFAILDPTNQKTLTYIQSLSGRHGWQTKIYIVSVPSMKRAWDHYAKRTFIDNLDLVRVSLKESDLQKFEKNFGELISLKESSALNTSRAMEIILSGAKRLHASDIHLEPQEESIRLRYRIDGVLQDIGELPMELYHLLTSRIKMISKMRLNIRKEAQDGHFFVDIENKRIDVRVSSIPGKYGESFDMRLLASEDATAEITSLGLRGLAYEELMKQVSKPNGFILNTGPTGSGKTTTLYALINHVNHPETKIITIEDPIEYTIPGIVQTEISKNKNYTFATALRSIVRQDPDVILVGEIRDDETADITVNAALTGHLVFSTLHTNNAAASIPRLLELGVKPFLISASLNALIGQRLVRKLCEHCKEKYKPAGKTIDAILKLITIISPKAEISLPKDTEYLFKSVGCQECYFTGYNGRIGIFEVLTLTKEIIEIINNLGTEQEILRAAMENGMVTMTQDGILKALEGITTLDEVWRVADQTDALRSIYAELMPSELSRSTHISSALLEEIKKELFSLEHFAIYIEKADSQLRMSALFAAALILKAGDIHIEPTLKTFEVRFRIDGILQTAASFPINAYPAFLAEIKLAAGLKSEERAGVTDGRFSITLEDPIQEKTETIDIRLSIILSGFGETIVMRFLNQSAIKIDLGALNIRKENLEKITAAISKPYGIILNTGPTGSGKTTTLYGILAKLNTPSVKIITVEDPIEYQMPGIIQTQVKEDENYTFATALRSLLRQNPDILMIGEIRDEETAQIAIQSANTGHLVISTLHTNSAVGVVSRLTSMGVSNADIANASNLFMAQRLVRKLCERCKVSKPATKEEKEIIEKALKSSPQKNKITEKLHIFHNQGCASCNGTGFAGQIAISETLLINKEVSELIAHGALVSEIEEKAAEQGMLTLTQDGLLAVLDGITTLEEVQRVTDL
jgi:type II secretory ATPase GspE/PulE/Tfp pilus assembly ATPase PilB-like protein